MQNDLSRDIYLVQNPAIGAAILWRFVCGYYACENKPVPFPLLFIVLPVVFREDMCTVIKSTQKRKGLSKVSERLFENKKKAAAPAAPAPAPAPAAPAPVALTTAAPAGTDDAEMERLAIMTAIIEHRRRTASSDSLVVRPIKRSAGNRWKRS